MTLSAIYERRNRSYGEVAPPDIRDLPQLIARSEQIEAKADELRDERGRPPLDDSERRHLRGTIELRVVLEEVEYRNQRPLTAYGQAKYAEQGQEWLVELEDEFNHLRAERGLEPTTARKMRAAADRRRQARRVLEGPNENPMAWSVPEHQRWRP